MKRPRQLRRRGSNFKTKPKLTRHSPSKHADGSVIGRVPDFAVLPNTRDQIVIHKLRSTPVGGLAVDPLVRNDPQLVPVLRNALIDVYSEQLTSLEPFHPIRHSNVERPIQEGTTIHLSH